MQQIERLLLGQRDYHTYLTHFQTSSEIFLSNFATLVNAVEKSALQKRTICIEAFDGLKKSYRGIGIRDILQSFLSEKRPLWKS